MDRIKNQADKLWQILSNPSTIETYKQTLALTWTIIRETGQLLWLVVCLVLVLGDWFWKYSYQAGQNARIWFHTIQTRTTAADESSNVLSETSKSLLAAGQASVSSLLNTAKGQLGIEPAAEAPRAISPARPAAPPTPALITPESPNAVAPPVAEVPEAAAEEVIPGADELEPEGLLKEPKVPAVEPTETDRAEG